MAKSLNINIDEFEDLMDLSEFDTENESFTSLEFDDFEEDIEEVPTVTFSKKLPNKQRTTSKVTATKPATKKVTPVVELESDEEPEDVKPKAKSTAKKEIRVKAEVPVTSKSVAQSKKTAGKTRVRNVTSSNATYEDLFDKVTEKVDKYKSIMDARESGKSKEIPQSVIISKELLISLLTAKFTEDTNNGVKSAMIKAMVSMGFDKADVTSAVESYSFKKVESDLIYNAVMDVVYEILNAEGGIPLFKNEDCNCTLKGEWTKPKLYDNAHLKTDKATYTDSYLKLTTSSPAPVNKKVTGVIKDKKFIPDEQE